ncbi:hypothetical protein JCM11251_003176 [Rhodosporidiobolus azoricus]
MSSDSEQSAQERTSKVFKGLHFFLHGPNPGITRGGLTRLINQGGGKVLDDVGNVKLSHVILSGNYWAKRKTASADLTLKQIEKANEENCTESDENYNRVWLLPVEWVRECLKKGKRVKEIKHDFERTEKAVQEKLAADRRKELADERRNNKGKSKFGRGGRVKLQNERRNLELGKEQEQLEKDPVASAEEAGEPFSGFIGLSSPAATSNPSPPPPAPKPFSSQHKLSFSISDPARPAKSGLKKPTPSLSSGGSEKSSTPFNGQYNDPTTFGFRDSTASSGSMAASSSPRPLARAGKKLKVDPSTRKESTSRGGMSASSRPALIPAARLASRTSSSLAGNGKGKGKEVSLVDDDSDSDAPLAKKLKRHSTGNNSKTTSRKASRDYTSSSEDGDSSDVPLAKKLKTTQARAALSARPPPASRGYSSDSSIVIEEVKRGEGASKNGRGKGDGELDKGKGKKRASPPSSVGKDDSSDSFLAPPYAARKKRVIAASEDEDE